MPIPDPLPHHWLALCLITESNRPEEWPFIAAVIFNRAASPRYPDTLQEVILQPKQFSAFNEVTKDPRKGMTLGWRFDYVMGERSAQLLCFALDGMANGMAITPTTLHYYSPVSMKPPGSAPPWAKTAKRLYTPEGIDPKRFVFAEGVR